MKDTRLLKIFNDTKDVLCKYDYYIHTAKRILHLTNTELKIPFDGASICWQTESVMPGILVYMQ